MTEDQVYSSIGEDGFTTIARGFYSRVKTDDLLGKMYPANDLEAAEQRLRDFLIQRFGGPATYSEARGHPRLRMRHAPFKVDAAARDRWLQLMEESMQEANLPLEVQAILRPYFISSANFMVNQP